jgi:hypothetical protein
MRAIIATVLLCLFAVPAHANQNNQVIKYCLQTTGNSFDTYDFTKAAACYQDWKAGAEAEKLAELRDFLKHNPRYRFPGQSNNRCWGKPREMPFESAYIERTGDGFRAGVSYKDKLPAGCYENGPWDNRDAKN